MCRSSALQLLLSLLVLASSHLYATSATIQPSDDVLCALKLEGPIVEGDSERLSAVVASSRLDPLDERTTSICLKSNGGSYSEGLKIAQLLFDRGLSTVIEFGSSCYSACATIFMAGVSSEREIPMRKLSIGGTLGFHAPFGF
jgi:hypothetical protein